MSVPLSDALLACGQRRPGPVGAARAILNRAGVQALLAHRLACWARESWRRPLRFPAAVAAASAAWLLSRWAGVVYDVRFDASEIGPGLRVYHFGGIRLRRCRVGAGCVIHQQVRLEPAEPGEEGPTLGDRVWVGPHAQIIGQVQVGDGAVIGAGARVTRDVAPRTVMLGDPARVMRVAYDNAELIRGL